MDAPCTLPLIADVLYELSPKRLPTVPRLGMFDGGDFQRAVVASTGIAALQVLLARCRSNHRRLLLHLNLGDPPRATGGHSHITSTLGGWRR